jgi:hypothetical protein
LVSSSEDSKVILWENFTSLNKIEYTAHNSSVEFAYFINDTAIISGDQHGKLNVWNFINNVSINILVHEIDNIISSDLYPDSTLVALGSRDGTISIYNLISGLNMADSDSDGMDDNFESDEGLDLNNFLDKFDDNDGDGLANILEYKLNSDVNSPDTDNDGMNDLFEYFYNLNLNFNDANGDLDDDGLSNIIEHDYGLNPLNEMDKLFDLDQDGLPNDFEISFDLNPLDPSDAGEDKDGDGIPNLYEWQNFLNIRLIDSHLDHDGDGMNNLWEYQMVLNAYKNDSYNDLDQDGLTNLDEFDYGSWANQSDSDLDGINDFKENLFSLNATDPMDALEDIDNDGVINRDEINNGSNPRDFFSVPLLSVSIIHLFVLITSTLVILVIMTGYFYNQRLIERKKALSLEEQEEALQDYMKDALEAVEEKKEN